MAQRKRKGYKQPTVRKASDKELLRELERRKPAWTEFKRIPDHVCARSGADEGWENSRYLVWIYKPDNEKSMRGDWNRMAEQAGVEDEAYPRFIQLSIKNHEKTVFAHDWRDMMRIKNELIHRDAEAMELYPAMNRICDEANQFHLWVLLPSNENGDEQVEWPTIPVGWHLQLLSDRKSAAKEGASQRDFEEGFLSEENNEGFERVRKVIEAQKARKPDDTRID